MPWEWWDLPSSFASEADCCSRHCLWHKQACAALPRGPAAFLSLVFSYWEGSCLWPAGECSTQSTNWLLLAGPPHFTWPSWWLLAGLQKALGLLGGRMHPPCSLCWLWKRDGGWATWSWVWASLNQRAYKAEVKKIAIYITFDRNLNKWSVAEFGCDGW